MQSVVAGVGHCIYVVSLIRDLGGFLSCDFFGLGRNWYCRKGLAFGVCWRSVVLRFALRRGRDSAARLPYECRQREREFNIQHDEPLQPDERSGGGVGAVMKMHVMMASVQQMTFRIVLANACRASDLNITQGVV